MKKIHDMGGQNCTDPLPSENDKAFEKEWHKTVLSLTLAVGALGQWNIDRSRYFREQLPPEDYQKFTYYEKWLAALVNLLVDSGLIQESELINFKSNEAITPHSGITSSVMKKMIDNGDPSVCDVQESKQVFAIGQMVKTRQESCNPFLQGGHTRLPAYSSGLQGRIVSFHGFHRLPDSHAHYFGPNPEPLYTVTFKANTLWGNGVEFPNDEVNLDLWHSYLEPLN